MASVAICPHCYLQLIVPDGVEPDERVECPTCAKEFGIDQAVLRPIPEVVRRSAAESALAAADSPNDSIELSDEISVEASIESSPLTAEREADDEAARYIEEVKARIEADIAEKGLVPGTNTVLSLEAPDLSMEIDEPAEDAPTEDVAVDPLAAFRNVKTVAEFSSFSDELEREDEIDSEVDIVSDPAEETAVAGAATDNPADELALEPPEPRESQPTVRTLADWMQPSADDDEQEPAADPIVEVEAELEAEVAEAEAALGPSFDLPNVPLVPNNGATVEFDVEMPIGPAAETEFELDDVDFQSSPTEQPADGTVAEENAPVFQEPISSLPAEPFILPGVPRKRKKHSVVRVLVGTALGAFVGLSIGYYILLFLLGPEGDLLQVAQYMPSAVLPKSFQTSTSVAVAAPPAAPPDNSESAAMPVGLTADDASADEDESSNVAVGYVEETSAGVPVASSSAGDDVRYGTEPAPLDEPVAEPIEHHAESVGTAVPQPQGPSFTVEELAEALEAGRDAQAGLVDGDLSDAAVRRTKGASYEKLAALAEALTFVDSSSPSVESRDAVEDSARLFGEVLSNPHTRSEVARIVTIWIPSPHRKNSGIFFAGSAQGGQIAGDVYEYQISTEAGSKFTLLCHEPLESSLADSGREFGIVGAIVDEPARNVTGYSGTAERAIWLTRAIPLD